MKTDEYKPSENAELCNWSEEDKVQQKMTQLKDFVSSMTLKEAKQILFKMQLHQIELEKQNEELSSVQAKLDESRARYFELYDSAPVGYITVNQQGVILGINFIASRLLGVTRETMVNQPITQVILDEDWGNYYQHSRKLFETGDYQSCELRVIKPDNTIIWVCLQAVTAQDSEGETVGRFVISEITAQKETQMNLCASEEKYRMITENISDVIWIYNLNQKRYTFFSPSILQLLGYTVEEALAISMEELMEPESYKILSAQFSNTLGHFVINPETSNSYVNEIQQPCKNGDNIWVEVTTKYRFNSLHEMEVLGLIRRIAARKEAEEQLMKERELLKNMLLFFPEGVILTDASGKVILMNPIAEHISGYGKEEIYGKEYDEFFNVINLLTRVKEPNPVRYVLETGNSFTPIHNMGLIRKDGSEIDFMCTASPILTGDGKINGVVVTSREITKEYERENEIEGFLNTNMELRCVTDLEGTFHRVNEKFEEILGYHATVLEGESFLSFVQEGDIQKTIEAIRKVKDKNVVTTLTNRFRSKDGSYRYIEWYTVLGAGKLAYSSGRDVTDRKKREEMLNELDIFFNISPDMISISQGDGCYLKVSRACETVLGYTKEEIEGNYFSQFVNPEIMTSAEIAGKQLDVPNQILNFTDIFHHKDGSYRNIEWRVHSNGRHIYSIGRDITERIKHEKQIEFSSYHDVLTGLFNRRFLEEEIKRMDTARGLPISIIMGDINRLKLVNDAFGHEKGDELIVKAAESIKESCRPEDLAARWGGDEFMIFLSKTSASEAEIIMNRILVNCADKQVNSIPVSIAFGIDTKTSASETISDVMRNAEDAMYKAKAKESERKRKDIIDTIAQTLYENNPYEEQHAKRVSTLCTKIAQALGLEEEEVKKLSMAGLLHDIGKVGVSVKILEKPSSLTKDEWKEVRQHPEIGYKVVGSSQEMIDIGDAIRAHHERPDGKGYPKGIHSEDIPAAAKIISIADSFDTMTGQNLYRKTITQEEAIAEIRCNEGTQFDPEIAEIFIEKVLLSLSGTAVQNCYCPFCGSLVDIKANFCWNCGHIQSK